MGISVDADQGVYLPELVDQTPDVQGAARCPMNPKVRCTRDPELILETPCCGWRSDGIFYTLCSVYDHYPAGPRSVPA